MRTPSRSSWDGDNTKTPVRRSAWDTPTPAHLSSFDEPRWTGTHGSLDTPLPTPSHLYNDWANDRKSFGRPTKEGNVDDDDIKFSSMEDRIEWEDEQKRMDRAWYDLDSGYDDTNNPFANIPEEYTKKKEEKLMKTTVKRMSAQQRQLNKDNEKWETNRLLTSGIVQQVDVDDDFEDEAESKVH
ncbi:PREDICTED: pre-mRNA-splicing factor ATP-dependent RNA helicase PRP16-like, partial [Amphimedon queenslandica]|uniref:Uncharacterized protein n=2 Tax=Amphimedon queenslandica TaxID=400682 RepID=A0AAN0K3L0_AMPQE